MISICWLDARLTHNNCYGIYIIIIIKHNNTVVLKCYRFIDINDSSMKIKSYRL